jgi:hypothetical protein
MINRFKMKLIALVGAKFTQQAVLGLLVALTAKRAAQNVLDQRGSLARDLPAVSDVKMPVCNGCKSIRKASAHPPRELVKMPIEITNDKVFNNRGLPLYLCEFCDEQELYMALATHEKRIDNK